MTYSIIARDAQSGQMGVAVQTCNLAVGTWVPWAAGGVGAVATQANAERRYGTAGLDLMRGGYSAPDALVALLAADEQRNQRQVSMLDSAGNVATHTGVCCIPMAGSHQGEGFCTQANMMARDTVWGAMAAAYQASQGTLAERLLAALEAAQAEGGDLRGQQTAALLVVEGQPSPYPLVDLRIDHHPQPVAELRRLLRLHQAYAAQYEVIGLLEEGNMEPVAGLIDRIAELAPHEPYLQCLRALHLERALNMRAQALGILQPLVEAQPQWRTYLEREARSGRAEGCPGLDRRLLDELDRLLEAQESAEAAGEERV